MASQSKKRRNKNSPAKAAYDSSRRDLKNKKLKKERHLKTHPNDINNAPPKSYKMKESKFYIWLRDLVLTKSNREKKIEDYNRGS